MNINISRLHYPVTVLGPGTRAGIWVQGCTIGCPGCVSRDTWNPHGGKNLAIGEVLAWLTQACTTGPVDGITISGGEPTEQAESLHLLVQGIHELRADRVFSGDILCFTGLDENSFHERCSWARDSIDAIITEPFRITEPTALLWRGSHNQRLVPLTTRGRLIYRQYVEATASTPQMQFSVTDGQVWMVGIPGRGDMQRLETALRKDGVTLGGVSWRPQ